MRNILFPTDYSDASVNAYKYALALADEENAELYVLHVYLLPIISGGIPPEQVSELFQKKEADHLRKMKMYEETLKTIQQELGKEKVKTHFKLKEGYLLPQIKIATKRYKIDFIVMGTEGDNQSKKGFLGDNTLNTIEHVKTPVLSVPKEAVYHSIKEVVFITNLNPNEDFIFDILVRETKRFGASIKCVHLKKEDEKDNYSEEVKQKWIRKYPEISLSFVIFSRSLSGVRKLIEYLKSQPVDIVSITHRPRNLLEKIFSYSTTIELGHKLGVPLLVFPKSLFLELRSNS